MRELMVEGLRAEVARRSEPEPRVDFVFTTVDGRGLRPEVATRQLTDLAYDLEAHGQ